MRGIYSEPIIEIIKLDFEQSITADNLMSQVNPNDIYLIEGDLVDWD